MVTLEGLLTTNTTQQGSIVTGEQRLSTVGILFLVPKKRYGPRGEVGVQTGVDLIDHQYAPGLQDSLGLIGHHHECSRAEGRRYDTTHGFLHEAECVQHVGFSRGVGPEDPGNRQRLPVRFFWGRVIVDECGEDLLLVTDGFVVLHAKTQQHSVLFASESGGFTAFFAEKPHGKHAVTTLTQITRPGPVIGTGRVEGPCR